MFEIVFHYRSRTSIFSELKYIASWTSKMSLSLHRLDNVAIIRRLGYKLLLFIYEFIIFSYNNYMYLSLLLLKPFYADQNWYAIYAF